MIFNIYNFRTMTTKTTQTVAKRRHCRRVLLGVAVLATFALFAACERPEPEPEPPSAPVGQFEFAWEDVTDSIPCLLLSMNSITLVNDNATLLNLCPDAPTFDFSNHSLIIVSGVAPTEVISVGVNFEQVEDMRYLLTIHVTGNNAAQPGGWRKYIKTPKISEPHNVSLLIEYEP